MQKRKKLFTKYLCLNCGHKWKEKYKGVTLCPTKCTVMIKYDNSAEYSGESRYVKLISPEKIAWGK